MGLNGKKQAAARLLGAKTKAELVQKLVGGCGKEVLKRLAAATGAIVVQNRPAATATARLLGAKTKAELVQKLCGGGGK